MSLIKINDLNKNFGSYEFQCPCPVCREKDAVPFLSNLFKLAAALQRLRDDIEKPIIITSGYRCKSYNDQIGGETDSVHLKSKAADIYVEGMSSVEVALRAHFYLSRVGVYIEANFCHVDIEEPHPSRFWLQKKRTDTLIYSKNINSIEEFLRKNGVC